MLFYESPSGCERIIEKIYKNKEKFNLTLIEDNEFLNYLDYINDNLGFKSSLIEYLRYGLAFHHAGLPTNIKEIIEMLINKNYIKIFSCTTTFAEGVNFPVHSIVFHTLFLYNEDENKMDLIDYRLYTNIIGRAGRALKFNEGLVLISNKLNTTNDTLAFNYINKDLDQIKSRFEFLKKKLPIKIKDDLFRKDSEFSDIQVDLLSFNVDNLNIIDYFKTTLGYNQNRRMDYSILKHLEAQKNYIKNFEFPEKTENSFRESGLNLLFCTNLYQFLIKNNFPKTLNEYTNVSEFLNSKLFTKINKWIFDNHSQLNSIDSKYYKLVNIWVNRKDLNYKEILDFSISIKEDFFKIIRIINKKITYIFPWIWSLINKIIYKFCKNSMW